MNINDKHQSRIFSGLTSIYVPEYKIPQKQTLDQHNTDIGECCIQRLQNPTKFYKDFSVCCFYILKNHNHISEKTVVERLTHVEPKFIFTYG